MLEPCNWTATPCADCCTEALDRLDDTVQAVLANQAVWTLWAATGKKFGLCETVLRPCRRECWSSWGGLPFPTRINGDWLNLSCGSCAGSCGCSVLSEFIAEDVDSIVAISIDGENHIPCDTAQVFDRRRIVRTDGEQWPMCQNLGAPIGSEGTWSVTVMQGLPVPAGGEIMAGILLCELAKACVGDSDCRLPKRLQTISRQGETMVFADQFENIDQIRTGLYEVDLWIEAARRDLYQGSTITSPDLPKPSVLTWPLGDDCDPESV